MDSLVEMFSNVDDFCQAFEPHWEQQQLTAVLGEGGAPDNCV
jgi:hypothetical protein